MTSDAPGRVVLLNGSASSGTSSLATIVHDRAESLWIVVRQDDFAQNLIGRWVVVDRAGSEAHCPGFNFVGHRDGTMTVEIGDLGRRLLRGYRAAVAAIARAGNNVLVDEAAFDHDSSVHWAEALHGLKVSWIKVDCSLAVAEVRESARSDRHRIGGLARGLYDKVHADVEYELTVDTSDGDFERCARRILDHLETDGGSTLPRGSRP